MHRFTLKGFEHTVRIEGPSSGSPVLLLHGFPDSHKLFDKQVPALVAAGHRVIVPDLLGFGDSAKPQEVEPYQLDSLVGIMVDLLDQLGIEQVAVVGHDWGSALAWHMAMSAPTRVSKLAALSVGSLGTYFATGDLMESMRQRTMSWYMLWFQFKPAVEEALSANDYAMLSVFGEPPEQTALWKADLSRPGALTAALNWYRANIKPEAFGVFEPLELPILQIPVLGVYRDEAYCSEAQMKASERYVAPGLWTYKKLSGFGHFIPREAADELNPLLVDFLAGTGGKGAAHAAAVADGTIAVEP
ncbi:hypothetical protein ABPG75_003423 [Micractinium tetrahymenae]